MKSLDLGGALDPTEGMIRVSRGEVGNMVTAMLAAIDSGNLLVTEVIDTTVLRGSEVQTRTISFICNWKNDKVE